MSPFDAQGKEYGIPARREYHAERVHGLLRFLDGYPRLEPVSFRTESSSDDAGQVLLLDMSVLRPAKNSFHHLFDMSGHNPAFAGHRSSCFRSSLNAHEVLPCG